MRNSEFGDVAIGDRRTISVMSDRLRENYRFEVF
jgi:hypothetical protein